MKPAIVGISGPVLLSAEAQALRALPPAGVILFARNIETPPQLAALVAELRRVLPAGAALMVDQEGGRVARLRPPHWPADPPAAAIGRAFAADRAAGMRAAWLQGALIGAACAAAGFTIVAAPVLDLAVPGAHDVIGDRAFAGDPRVVAQLGRALADGLLAAGVVPVGKHAPGHGRARADSHLALPRVESAALDDDIHPFAENADLPCMMTAHILYPALDPARPATLSPLVIGQVIRGRIGFSGLLLSDDLAMQALEGSPPARALAALAAGCDLALYCPGESAPTRAVLAALPEITLDAATRLADAHALARSRVQPLDVARLREERSTLLA
jgi:beta-N-acetylhexosaminidase